MKLTQAAVNLVEKYNDFQEIIHNNMNTSHRQDIDDWPSDNRRPLTVNDLSDP